MELNNSDTDYVLYQLYCPSR